MQPDPPHTETFERFFHHSPVAILLVDDQGTCVDANPAARLRFGRPTEPFVIDPPPLADFAVHPLGTGLHAAFLRDNDADRSEKYRQEALKSESLGLLAGGVANLFNNLLTSIIGNASLVGMSLPPTSPLAAYIGQIEKSASRAAELCKQLMAYAGKGRFEMRWLELNPVVAAAERDLRSPAPSGVRFASRLAADLPRVRADASQLQQVLLNLAVNAREALPPAGGSIEIATGTATLSAADLAAMRGEHDTSAGDYAYFEVADSGTGIAPEVALRMFDPFFTTKSTGRGLGLSVVQGIVRGHRGAIAVETQPGRGTRVRVYIPAEARRKGGDQ